MTGGGKEEGQGGQEEIKRKGGRTGGQRAKTWEGKEEGDGEDRRR